MKQMSKQLLKLNKQGERLVTEVVEVSPRESEIISMYCKLRNKYFELLQAEKNEEISKELVGNSDIDL